MNTMKRETSFVAPAIGVVGLVVVGLLLLQMWANQEAPEPSPEPAPVRPAPAPEPPRRPCPPDRPCPREEVGASVGAQVAGRISQDGVPIQLDFPADRHRQNKGGSDRKGLCVFTSGGHSADWCGLEFLVDFRDWMTKYPGGGWPEKVDEMIAKKAKEAGVPIPEYVQYSGSDLSVLDRMCAAGIMPACTYYRSPTGRYGGSKIYHMVTILHADGNRYAVLDNNYIGANAIEWMSKAEVAKAIMDGGSYWCYGFLRAGPPPVPRNI